MYCPHCKKEVAGNDGVCEDCGDILMSSGGEYVGKKRIKTRELGHLPRYMIGDIVGLILMGLIFLGIYLGWRHEYPYILKNRANYTMQLADSVHTTMLMAMMDEDLKKNPEFDSDLQELTTEFDITECRRGENCVLDRMADIYAIEEFDQLKNRVNYPHATKRIMVTVTGENKVTVRIEGAVYDGGEIMIQ